MGFVAPQFGPAMAEVILATGICLVLLADLFISERNRGITLLLSLATLAATAWTVGAGSDSTVLTFSGSYIADPLARVLKMNTSEEIQIYMRDQLQAAGLGRFRFAAFGLLRGLGI